MKAMGLIISSAVVAILAGAAWAADHEVSWHSINGGGAHTSSANHIVVSSVAQSTIGFTTRDAYEAGIGFWYGVGAIEVCDCPYQCDFDEDGFITAIDLGVLIDILFAGAVDPQDPLCPGTRGDFDCDGFTTALDLGGLIDHLFAGCPPPCDPCECSLYPVNCPPWDCPQVIAR